MIGISSHVFLLLLTVSTEGVMYFSMFSIVITELCFKKCQVCCECCLVSKRFKPSKPNNITLMTEWFVYLVLSATSCLDLPAAMAVSNKNMVEEKWFFLTCLFYTKHANRFKPLLLLFCPSAVAPFSLDSYWHKYCLFKCNSCCTVDSISNVTPIIIIIIIIVWGDTTEITKTVSETRRIRTEIGCVSHPTKSTHCDCYPE